MIGAIAIATYNLNSKQEISSSKDSENSGIHFVKANIPLPEFSLPNLFDQSKSISKQDLMGKYSIVSFFASWCTTCKAQHHVLMRLKHEKLIDIYGIAWRDIDENTKALLQKTGNPYKKTASDSRGLFSKISGLQAVPETWIINKKGVIVMRFRGNLHDFSVDEIRTFLNNQK